MSNTIDAAAVHDRQQRYVDDIKKQGFDFGLVVAEAFVKSIRDLGYRSTGTALNELVDNAAEAGAENIHVTFGFSEGSRKPAAIAVIDDGIGMVPDMIRASVVWGGTDRHDSRVLFGRYGYGLPSSSVSQGRRFSVYSRTVDGAFYAVTLDLDEISEGKYIVDNRIGVPEPVEAELPDFVVDYAQRSFPGGLDAVKSAVVWLKLDRLSFATSDRLENHLLEIFGVTYRNHLRQLGLVVNGKNAEPVDPLFLTEGGRFYDVDEDRAEPVDQIIFEVRDKESRVSLGQVRVRFSLMPPTFARVDKTKAAEGKNQNKRFPILKDHNGLIVLRAGRQIDVVTKGKKFPSFQHNDRYIGVEVDFPPTLDELFGVTTHKQQITLSERLEELLEENGVWTVFFQLRKRYNEMLAELAQRYDTPQDGDGKADGKRPSEAAMEEAAKLDPPAPPSDRRTHKADEGREHAIQELVDKGLPRPEAERVVETVARDQPFKVEMERLPGAPFYRVELRGGQVVLLINVAHRFYTDVYGAIHGPEGARVRQALEVLLFVIGRCELDGSEDRQLFYESERQEWSRRLNVGLAKLGGLLEQAPGAPDAEEVELAQA